MLANNTQETRFPEVLMILYYFGFLTALKRKGLWLQKGMLINPIEAETNVHVVN